MAEAIVVSSDAPDVAVSVAPERTPTPTGVIEDEMVFARQQTETPQGEESEAAKAERLRGPDGKFVSADVDTGDDDGLPEAKKGSPQYRINQAVRRQREAEREREAIRAEREQMAAQIATYETLVRAGVIQPNQQQKPPADTGPQEKDFQRYEDYIEARADWRAEKKASERAEALFNERFEAMQRQQAETSQLRAEQALIAEHRSRIERGVQTHADFEEVVTQDIPLSKPMEDAILHSDMGHELMYYLGRNPNEAYRIGQLPVAKQLVEMGRIEARLDTATPAPASRPVSQAPPPVRPVSGGAHTAPLSLESLSGRDYIRERNRIEMERRR